MPVCLLLNWCLSLEKDWENLVENLINERILHSQKVIKAMRIVPRARFLPESVKPYSAADTPLPIGFGQTVSAPHSFSVQAELGDTWFR